MILRTENGPLYFEISGQGPPLVFISGWAMSSQCWRPVVSMLERKFRCLTFDARGVGRSQPSSQSAQFRVYDHSEDLHSILEQTDIYDATFIAHETGALVAAECALTHPQYMRGLAVVSPRPAMTQTDVKRLALYTPASLALRELAAYPVIRNIVARRFGRAPQPFRDVLFGDFAELNPRAAYETAASASSEEAAYAFKKVIERIVAPVLFICGEKDKKGAAEARRLFSLARSARLATMRDCGFLPMLEFPRQFARLIDDFRAKSQEMTSHSLLRRQ